MENLRFCSGEYINIYDEDEGKEVFVIINEGNDELTIDKAAKAEEIIRKHFDSMDYVQLETELEDVFGFGVQIFFRKMNDRFIYDL